MTNTYIPVCTGVTVARMLKFHPLPPSLSSHSFPTHTCLFFAWLSRGETIQRNVIIYIQYYVCRLIRVFRNVYNNVFGCQIGSYGDKLGLLIGICVNLHREATLRAHKNFTKCISKEREIYINYFF